MVRPEKLKIRRKGNDAMMKQYAIHIGYGADMTAHPQDNIGRKIKITEVLAHEQWSA